MHPGWIIGALAACSATNQEPAGGTTIEDSTAGVESRDTSVEVVGTETGMAGHTGMGDTSVLVSTGETGFSACPWDPRDARQVAGHSIVGEA